MELLLAAATTLLAQGFKWLAQKTGFEKAKNITLLFAFLVSVIGVFGWKRYTGELNWSSYEQVVSVFGIAVAYYEVIIKRFITPILNGRVNK